MLVKNDISYRIKDGKRQQDKQILNPSGFTSKDLYHGQGKLIDNTETAPLYLQESTEFQR